MLLSQQRASATLTVVRAARTVSSTLKLTLLSGVMPCVNAAMDPQGTINIDCFVGDEFLQESYGDPEDFAVAYNLD